MCMSANRSLSGCIMGDFLAIVGVHVSLSGHYSLMSAWLEFLCLGKKGWVIRAFAFCEILSLAPPSSMFSTNFVPPIRASWGTFVDVHQLFFLPSSLLPHHHPSLGRVEPLIIISIVVGQSTCPKDNRTNLLMQSETRSASAMLHPQSWPCDKALQLSTLFSSLLCVCFWVF